MLRWLKRYCCDFELGFTFSDQKEERKFKKKILAELINDVTVQLGRCSQESVIIRAPNF